MRFCVICLVAIFSLSRSASAQLRYRVDTFEYNGHKVPLRRSSTPQLDSFQKLSRIAFQLSLYVQKLQKQLEEAKDAVNDNRTIYDYTLSRAQELIDQATEYYPAFEMDLYRQELRFYEQYKKDFVAELND